MHPIVSFFRRKSITKVLQFGNKTVTAQVKFTNLFINILCGMASIYRIIFLLQFEISYDIINYQIFWRKEYGYDK